MKTPASSIARQPVLTDLGANLPRRPAGRCRTRAVWLPGLLLCLAGDPSPSLPLCADPVSPPRIEAFGQTGAEQFWFTWSSQADYVYQVERTSRLDQPFVILAANLPATPPSNTFTDTVQTAAAFYRVQAAPAPAAASWPQHARDAQRTGYAPAAPAPPWRWAWQWNGSDAAGRVAPDKILLPRNVQPVVAAGRVFIACGTNGVVALNETNGAVLWQSRPGGAINSTVAYDAQTAALFAVSSNGRLYKLDANDGRVLGECGLGAPNALPLPPAVLPGRVLAAMGRFVLALDPVTLSTNWLYDAGAVVHTPPAYSARRDLVVVCTADLHVHGIRNADGARRWRVKPGVHPPGDPYEYARGWPVIAEQHGLVLVRQRIHWDRLWDNPNPFGVPDNATIRARLAARPEQRCHFALRLDDGAVAFDINNGQGGFGDGGYLPLGSMPIIRTFPDGTEVALQIIRGDHRYDARWDSHFGEMVLDDTTVPGLQAGDVRWIRHGNDASEDAFLLTDEQPFLSAAGDYLFGSHWLVTYALRVLDRGPAYGTFARKISTANLPWFIVSQGRCGPCKTFAPSHYCATGLAADPDCGRLYAGGFYVCFDQGAVHDRFWTEYGCVVATPERLIVRDTTGAIFCLVSGNPLVATAPAGRDSAGSERFAPDLPAAAPVAVTDRLRYVFNNGKFVLLAFAEPHQGTFKALIPREAWGRFAGLDTRLGRNRAGSFREGQTVTVTGEAAWYQGDPAVYVTRPEQIILHEAPVSRGPRQWAERSAGDAGAP